MSSTEVNIAGPSGAFLPDEAIVKLGHGHEDLIHRDFAGLIQTVTYVQGGMSFKDWAGYHAQVYILASTLELYQVETIDTKQSLIRDALLSLQHEAERNFDKFRHALAEQVRQKLAQPMADYRVVLPLNIHASFSPKPTYCDVFDTRLHFQSWNYLGAKLDLEAWKGKCYHEDRHLLESENIGRNTPVVAVIKSRDGQEAFAQAVDRFELMRAAFNMHYCWGKFQQTWAGRPHPLGRLFAPSIYGVFRADGSHELTFVSNEVKPAHDAVQLTQEQIDKAKRLLRRLNKYAANSEIGALLADGTKLYGQALESVDWREGFLSLWQVLELITYRPPAQYNIKEVQKRVATLLQGDQTLIDLLTISGEARNQLVHRGRFSEDGQTAVVLLKQVVEVSLMTLGYLCHRLQTWSELETYYRYAALPSASLGKAAKVLRLAQKLTRD